MQIETDEPEKLLLVRLRDGDHSAFESLYHTYSRQLYWHLSRMVKDQHLAEELLQELFVKVWHAREKVRSDRPFIGFLYLVAKQLAIDHYRRMVRQHRMQEFVRNKDPQHGETTQDQVIGAETRRLLDDAIGALPPQRRRAFELCKVQGKSHKEAGEIMGVSPFTVQNHVAKATAGIREYLHRQQTPPSTELLALVLASALFL